MGFRVRFPSITFSMNLLIVLTPQIFQNRIIIQFTTTWGERGCQRQLLSVLHPKPCTLVLVNIEIPLTLHTLYAQDLEHKNR